MRRHKSSRSCGNSSARQHGNIAQERYIATSWTLTWCNHYCLLELVACYFFFLSFLPVVRSLKPHIMRPNIFLSLLALSVGSNASPLLQTTAATTPSYCTVIKAAVSQVKCLTSATPFCSSFLHISAVQSTSTKTVTRCVTLLFPCGRSANCASSVVTSTSITSTYTNTITANAVVQTLTRQDKRRTCSSLISLTKKKKQLLE